MLESKRRATLFITISLVLACIAGFLFFRQVQHLNSQLGELTEVYVAARDIPSRTPITAADLKTIQIPNKYVTSSNITDPAQLQNKVVLVALSKDALITTSMLKPVSNIQNENNRLVALYSSEKVRFDQQLEALDRVDLIVSENFEGEPKTTVFMKDVTVAVVMNTDGQFAGVGLEVSEKDAPKLIHMQNYADQIRVLKANVGKANEIPPEQPAQQQSQQTQQSQTNKPAQTAPAANAGNSKSGAAVPESSSGAKAPANNTAGKAGATSEEKKP